MRFGLPTRLVTVTLFLCGISGWLSCDGLPRPVPTTRSIPFDTATVTRDGQNYLVSWHSDEIQHVKVYAGLDPNSIGSEHLVSEGTGTGQATVSKLPSESRWYFRLQPDKGQSLMVGDRSLHLTTAANFRDVGGYRTGDGQWVRMGLAYRSNGLEHLSDQELAQIERLHIKLVCDLRTAEERARGPDRATAGATEVPADVLADDADLIHSLMAGRANTSNGASGTAPAPTAEDMEQRIYRDFVRLPSAQRAYHALLTRLADPAQLPTVFHCTAGKDRTGWAQAVLLTILGVPRSTIVEDYVLTNAYLNDAALNGIHQAMSGVAPTKIVANPAALDAGFDEVVQRYGSFDRYLHEGLHLDDATLAALRRTFLQG